MTHDAGTKDALIDAVLSVMDGQIERASNRVYEWPDDEADLHRNGNHGSFTERAEAVSRLRATKIVDAVLDGLALCSPQQEWAVEITWCDPIKAGAKGATSQFGPFEQTEHLESFLDLQRRDRDVAATRVLTRAAAYSPWVSDGQPEPTSEEDRNKRLARYYAQNFPHLIPLGDKP